MLDYGCSLLHRQVHEFSASWKAVKRNKMDSEILTCLLKFIEYFPDNLSALSRTLLRFFWTTFVETAVYIFTFSRMDALKMLSKGV